MFGFSFCASALTCDEILKNINNVDLEHIEAGHCTYDMAPITACNETNKSQFDTHYCHTEKNMLTLIGQVLSDPECKVYENEKTPGNYEFVGSSGEKDGIGATYSNNTQSCIITGRAKGYYNPNKKRIDSFFPFVPMSSPHY